MNSTMTLIEIILALSLNQSFVYGYDPSKQPEPEPAPRAVIEVQHDEHFEYTFEPVRTIICDTRTNEATIIEYQNDGRQNVTYSQCGTVI